MRRFFWAMHYRASGQVRKTRTGNESRSKRNQAFNAEAEFWRCMALKRVGSWIVMPRRHFMGNDDQAMQRKVQKVINNELENFIKKHSNGRYS